MKISFRALFASALLATASLTAQAQATTPAAAPVATPDTARVVLNPALLTPISLQSFEAFRTAVQPLIRQMAGKKVVALGEGTHGTAEFYRVRFWLTRILVEDHGYTQVALENDYTDTYLLDEALRHPAANVSQLMQRHLYGIWQNQETKELLTWLQAHNRTHRRQPLALRGIDGAYALPEAQQLATLAARYPKAGLQPLAAQLLQAAGTQDSVLAYINTKFKGYKFSRKRWLSTGLDGYYAAEKILAALPTARLPRSQRALAEGYATDAMLALDVFYKFAVTKKDASRDSTMAEMTRFLVREPGAKVIIWAHNAHVSRKSADPTDNNGGGTGSFIERLLPGQYFALGTTTATGTYAATTDGRITRTSVFTSYPLDKPLAGSWEASLAGASAPNFFLLTNQLGTQNLKRPHRLVGYMPDSGKDSYYDYKLSEAYDAVLFLRQTTAATPL
ncbi:erythromycin esterase family protein [Hymenobacter negativus]|uniref:Erythromycin esterase family protein n=1 Tax=Hymenobacter negativus TaxID=2795026 RepID=A0ABS3QGQ5_9BACT|nr:erythromycin esterase family protein [Hymenobacter negativus]MBO2009910.1 erythromycin esterase family protein [Hymenobacter negativus]